MVNNLIYRTILSTTNWAKAEVGLLSRNLKFKGNDDARLHERFAAEACEAGFDSGEFLGGGGWGWVDSGEFRKVCGERGMAWGEGVGGGMANHM